MTPVGLTVARFLAAAFLGVLFLQSGLDKVLDWKGNRASFGESFAKTSLGRLSGFLLLVVTVLEVLVGVTSAAGALEVLVGESGLAFTGASVGASLMLFRFIGQRIAKDHAGATGMVPYFIVAVGAVLLESP